VFFDCKVLWKFTTGPLWGFDMNGCGINGLRPVSAIATRVLWIPTPIQPKPGFIAQLVWQDLTILASESDIEARLDPTLCRP
jgi:hypothetical protein